MKCVCLGLCCFLLDDNSEAMLCFEQHFNLHGDPVCETPWRTRGRPRRGFCWEATVCGATGVGLGLSFAARHKRQDLGRSPPCAHGDSFAVAVNRKSWRCSCMWFQHCLQLFHTGNLGLKLGCSMTKH